MIRLLVLSVSLLPIFLFPPMKLIPVTGSYTYETASYTWTDESRAESFRNDGSSRQVAVQFWYPVTEKEEKFPLVVFSHGAFGYGMSNYSAYTELASNGYVVCSVEHPYHALFSRLEDGQLITADKDFIRDVFRVNEEGVPEEEIFSVNRTLDRTSGGGFAFCAGSDRGNLPREIAWNALQSDRYGKNRTDWAFPWRGCGSYHRAGTA